MPSALPRMGAVARLTPESSAFSRRVGDWLLLAELVPPGQVNLRGDRSDPAFTQAAGSVLGCLPPAEANRAVTASDLTVLWLGPDEWLILTPPDGEATVAEALRGALTGLHAAVTDVSGNRARFRLSGPGARETLLKGCSFDLHPRAFGPGRCAQTLLARAGIILQQVDDAPTYDILPRRSFGEYVWAWLKDAMAEYGGRVVS